ncbi:MAG TPA: CARDB domain-containing protein [Bacteroidales bacterium]|nr:CARDB domain-containing protein [Bacteroidales bacterium]
MKKLLLVMLLFAISTLAIAQTIHFHENFDPGSGPDSVTATGSPTFAINTRLYYSGTQCDSLKTPVNSISYLTTQPFSTVGSNNVLLKFAHICKVEIFDTAKVEISVNGGPWIKLTTQYINPGNSQFLNQSYRFCAATYPVDWVAANDTIKPQQNWWRYEMFDITALAANSSNVQIRFALRGNVSNDVCHGWYLDDILVVGGISELLPPKITMKAPIIQDTVLNTGPFDIHATITDVSGIDTAYIVYQLNNGANQYIPMVWVSDSTYKGTIPSHTYNNRIDYHVFASDNSALQNTVNGPDLWFYIKQGPSQILIGSENLVPGNTLYCPLYRFSSTSTTANSISNIIYTAAELAAAGILPGATITTLSFDKNGAGASNSNPITFSIYMANTSNVPPLPTTTTWGSILTSHTLVYSSTAQQIPPVSGWVEFTLQTPFIYTGGSLEIATRAGYSGTQPWTTDKFDWKYSSGTADKIIAYVGSTITASTVLNATTSSYKYRPNIKIGLVATNYTFDAGVTQILGPTGTLLTNTNYPVTLNFKNFAADSLKKVTIAWEVDGALQTPSYNWTGVLLQDVVSGVITMGNVNVSTTGNHTVRAWTELPNDSTDENTANDTASISFYACSNILNGIYAIGPTGDFTTFSDALTAMQTCGISGPVTFNVQSGMYNERLVISEIPGASAINTITFQSLTGVNTDVVLQDTTNTTTNYVIKLDGADHLRFKNMTLQSSATTAYTRVIELAANAIDNQFDGNIVTAPAATASSTNTALIYSGAGLDSLSVINNNEIINGSYGIYLYGGSSTSLENKTTITNNTFLNQYQYAIRLGYQAAPVISGNIITTNSTAAFYGIYTYYCDNALKILKNIISLTSGGYGIYISYCDGASGQEGLTANNFVSIGGTTATYGIYNGYSTFQNFYYNSINVYTDYTTARAMYMIGTTYPYHNYKNNIFAYTGTNASGMAFYVSTVANVNTSEFNDLYSTGTNLGYWGANQATLAAWQIASSKDSNSVSVNPNFISPADLHTFTSSLNGYATPIAGITDDIDGEPRDAATPDIGADEFAPLSVDLGILEVISPVHVSCGLGNAENVSVRIKNFGGTTITNANIYYKLNNGTPVLGVFSGSLLPDSAVVYTFPTSADLSAIANYTFDFYVVLTGDLNPLNDTIADYAVSNGWDFYTSEYNMGFEPTEDYSQWSVVNTGGEASYKWDLPYSSSTYSNTGTYSARFYNNTSNTGEDWLFSRCFYLEAGDTYSLSFWYRSYSATYPQTLTLKYGNAASPAAMTTTLATLVNFVNTVHIQSVSQFVAPASGVYYFGWSGTVGSMYYAYIDDINIKLIPNQEAAVLSMETPESGCGLSNAEPVTIHIKNTGGAAINGNLNASYKIAGGTTITEPVTAPIATGDTLDYIFSTPANLAVTTQDSVFTIQTWINLLNDPVSINDTVIKQINSLHVPLAPVVIGDTVAYGQPAILQAISPDSVNWFADSISAVPIHQGHIFNTPALYADTTYYAEAMAGSIPQYVGPYDYSIGTSSSYSNTTYYLYFDVLKPGGITIHSIDVFPSTAPGAAFTIQLLNSGGTVLQTFSGVTTAQAGDREVVPVNFNVPFGTEYRVKFGVSGGFYRNTTGASYPYVIPNVISINGNSFTGYPQYYYFFYNWKVSGEGCPSERIPVIAHVELMTNEASVVSMPAPLDPCSDVTETISIKIRNNGVNTINGGLMAKYAVNGGTVVAEPVTGTILPGDTLLYTFATPFITGLSHTVQDSVYNILSYIELAGDTFYANDTIHDTVTLNYTPPAPVVSNITIPYGTSATINAVSAESVFWYDVPLGGTAIYTGLTYTTPVLYGNTVYYTEAMAGTSTLHTGMAMPYPTAISGAGTTNYGLVFDALSAFTLKSVTVYPVSATGASGTVTIDVINSSGTVLHTTTANVTGSPVGTPVAHLINLDFDILPGTNMKMRPGYTGISGLLFEPSAAAPGGNYGYPYVVPGVLSINTSTLTAAPTNTPRNDLYYYFYDWVISGGLACASPRVADTVFVTGIPSCDVSVQAIHTPNSGIELSAGEAVSVRLKNFGTSPAVNIPIHYSLNGGAPVTETIPGPIAQNDTLLYTFAATADMSAITTYDLAVYTGLSCDTTLINDTVHKTVVNNPLVYCVSGATSTSYCDISNVTVSNINNGNPLPVYSNPTCVATYTDYTSVGPGILQAGMTYPISVSQCNPSTSFGVSLANVYLDYNRNGMFDLPQEKIFSAPTSSTATTVSGVFTVPTTGIVTNVPTRLRVVLDYNDVANPCGTYTYGETEDYSVVLLPQIPHDAGVTTFIEPAALLDEGVSAPVEVIVKNYGLDTITNASNLSIAYSYGGGPIQSITWAGGDILPMDTVIAVLPNLTVIPNDQPLCAWTILAGDSNTMNDSACMTLSGTPQIDAAVTAILQPGTSLQEGASQSVQVTLENFGADTLTSMNLVYTLDGVTQATQPWTGSLLPGATTNVTFSQTFVVPAAGFTICAYVSLATDANHINDTLCMNFYGLFTSVLPYYDDFDGANVNWLAGPVSNGSVWELGTPNYGSTNTAHSTPNAWDVNLNSAYTNSVTTYLYTQNFDFSTVINAKMKFWLNYNLETGYDGLRVEYTTNGGTTWQPLGILNDTNAVNWYNDDVINSNGPGWTNTSSGWKQSEYKLTILNNVPLVRFRFVFFTNASGINSGASVDDFAITIPFPQDAGVQAIKTPVLQAPAGSSVVVKSNIKNFGSDTLYSIPVSYRLGLTGTPVTQTWTGTLYPEDTTTLTFSIPVAIPAGAFNLYSYTGLSVDGDHFNDTAVNHITGVPVYHVPYNDDYEGLVTWFGTGTTNLWEWGVPAATLIDSAYSPTHAWVTNLDGDYINSAVEYLYSPLFMFTGVDSAYLEFWHWYDTEINYDGCQVQYAINNGTWTALGTLADPNGVNWYNSTASTFPCWSGSSNGYVYSRYRLTAIPSIVNATTPVQFRFKFFSDVSGVNEGWAIDNFAITAPPIPQDAGVTAILQPNAATQTGSSVTVQVTIKNHGTGNLTTVPVRYVINGGAVTAETWTGNLAPGATTNYTFAAPYVSPGITYDLCAFTKATGDIYTFNDTTCASFNTTPAPHDVGVSAMISPSDTTVYNQSYPVTVYIKNFGTEPETSIPVVFSRNGVQVGAGVWTGTLNGGDSVLYTFTTQNVSPQGNYQLCAKTMLAGDSDPANDQSCKYLYGMTGIESYDYSGFVLYQNVPNPAVNITDIVFNIPERNRVRFEMYDLLGKAIRSEDLDAVKGENKIELDASVIPDGIYFYAVYYKGEKQTKRMVIAR